MKTIGLIVEYNPLHTGHIEHINKAKRLFDEEVVIIAVMSGNVVQRGEFSIYSKFDRTKAAIDNGVDIVVELPAYYSLNNANIFAKGAIKVLKNFGCEYFVFGSETNDLDRLKENANVINNNKELIQSKVKELQSFPKAIEAVLGDKFKSNDILGTTYILENNLLEEPMTPLSIKREQENFKNASDIRKTILNGEKEKEDLVEGEISYKMEDFFDLIKAKITLDESDDPFIKYVKNKLDEFKGNSWYEFLEFSTNSSFTKAKLSREILKWFLNIEFEDLDKYRVLGVSNTGKKYLRDSEINYFSKYDKEIKNELKIAKALSLKYDNAFNDEIKWIIYSN